MKKILFIILLGLGIQSLVIAQSSTYRSGEFIRVSESDSIQTQLLAAGQTIEVLGWIGNDLFSAAELLSVDGNIKDDAIVAGRRISIRGTIGDLLMGAAETFIIDGQISGDVFIAGREIRITNTAQIKGNVYVAAASLIVDGGTIEGQLTAAAGEINLNGIIHNKANLYGNNFNFGPNYEAEYGTDITSDEPVHRENLGNIPENLNITINEPSFWPVILFKIGFYFALLVTGLVLIWVFPQTTADLYRFSTEKIWKNTGVGLLTFIIWPLIIFLLFILILTMPLSIILILLYGITLLVSYLLVSMILGLMSISYFQKINAISTYYWGLALGIIFVGILVNLPFIGWLFNIILMLFGLGSLVYYFLTMRTLNYSTE